MAVCTPVSASAQANVGVYHGLGVPGPVATPPPSVIYQPSYGAPGTYGPPGTYQSAPPPVIYQAPPVYGYGQWHGNGWHRGREHHGQWDND
ncbi:hypothetical protein [Paraburkholderia diazotrophica]|uniref:hypothetical protein n=1 Tax=Paraburkholderia diazotrophica TaxID=667676 RepID=UPI002ADD7C97|nr:hypothetical protein [Paraburkholderia diazotrophica]